MSADGLYIQMFSIHGLLRAENMELGRDADTGGQIKYVIELCNALSRHPKVGKVDLFTRLVSDKSVSEDYARPVEPVNDAFRIVRSPDHRCLPLRFPVRRQEIHAQGAALAAPG